ncbi:hypothetical protein [Treponema sp.]|uniref:hypothetical protein n=1 Tax=Treponema sp. TaxID=166 RepID=UPI001D8685D7|nr:hypothetical protein [Treponema sp.]MBS7241248.1 hypothetical protein [Treponema sp.]MCI6442757.1 hypothetical protein [Spirochaetia bacterium]MDY4132016.1 hypothetical protein [Treponema sp.]
MKLQKLIFAALTITVLGCTSISAKAKKVKANKNPVEQMDWQGASTGRDIPEWVDYVVDGDTAQIAKELKLPEDKWQLFVILGQGPNLDFVKAWTDNVDVIAEVAQALSRVVKTDLQANMNSSDPAQINKALDMADRVVSLVELNGLVKKNQYWIQTRTAKVKKPKKDKDYNPAVYNYYVVYAMDKATYEESIRRAVDKGFENEQTSEAQTIKDVMMTSLTKTIAPEAIGSETETEPTVW